MQIYHSASPIVLTASILLSCGCNGNADDESSIEISIQGLFESQSVVACAEQRLNTVSDPTTDSTTEFTWDVTAPKDAAFAFHPNGSELRFIARTPGEYLVSATKCQSLQTTNANCAGTELSITVQVGDDLNKNGIGDLCESNSCIPDCSGRVCGEDPVCKTSCGSCTDSQTCDETVGQCKAACIPDCSGRVCGPDRICGTSCGTCSADTNCNAQGTCDAVPALGRVVTMVMGLSDPRLAYTDPRFSQRARLIEQSVLWVSKVSNPRVLVVLGHNGADLTWDPVLVRSTLNRRGISAISIKEPIDGLRAEQLKGFNVIWFSSPDQPIDAKRTIEALSAFAHSDGGLVLQGNDITQPSEMQPLTRLHHVSTGKYYCGLYIDDDRGASYKVAIERISHPVTAGLLGNSYYYGDDIDSSTLIPDSKATVLAWATAGWGAPCNGHTPSGCQKQPVIVAYDMNQ